MISSQTRAKNRRLLTGIFLVVLFMVGMSFAAVPLYKVFCQVTGFGGTTQVSAAAPADTDVLDRTINVKFNADVARNVLWSFQSDQRDIDVRLGQQGLISFSAKNTDRVPVTAVAVYNVTPPKAGKYFHKIQCFCFGEQTLNPGEKATYPVVFFVDPALDKDPNMTDVTTITLSYTFFQAETPELEAAMESFAAQSPSDPATAGTVALPPEKQ
ncbi:MAG: cytochrome c oxidase assembly protein [Micavibrio sp.]